MRVSSARKGADVVGIFGPIGRACRAAAAQRPLDAQNQLLLLPHSPPHWQIMYEPPTHPSAAQKPPLLLQ